MVTPKIADCCMKLGPTTCEGGARNGTGLTKICRRISFPRLPVSVVSQHKGRTLHQHRGPRRGEPDAVGRPPAIPVHCDVRDRHIRHIVRVKVALRCPIARQRKRRFWPRDVVAVDEEVEVVEPEVAALGEDERVGQEDEALARLQRQQGFGKVGGEAKSCRSIWVAAVTLRGGGEGRLLEIRRMMQGDPQGSGGHDTGGDGL